VPHHKIAVSRAAGDALAVLGTQIRLARQARGWSLSDTAARLGIDRRTMTSVEAGAPGVGIGTVFTAAYLVGVDLFGLDGDELAAARRRGKDTLALLPAKVRTPTIPDRDDDFDF
jgi:transcriptional regulator with XRE-family HTH domain